MIAPSVWEYTLPYGDPVQVAMVPGAQMLSVRMDGNQLYLYALVDIARSTEAAEIRTVRVVGSYTTMSVAGDLAPIGTYSDQYGTVWHVFEVR